MARIRRFLYLFVLALAVAFAPGARARDEDGVPERAFLDQLPAGDDWLRHLNEDLLPFWTLPAALGNPLGAFPSVRCDDGSALDYTNPCEPVASNGWLMSPTRYLVSVSRQMYGYGVAYHLTGETRYLDWMKAGVAYIRRNAIDPAGGMFTQFDMRTGRPGPEREFRNPQELGYGLLGLAFYYYLTRDDSVLNDILSIQKYISDNYYNQSLGAMQWLLESNGEQRFDNRQLVADLDQMNTYLVLLAPILPEPQQREFKNELLTLSRSILAVYYSPHDNLVFLSANSAQDRDLQYSGPDFGHTSKALWMIRFTGEMTGDAGLFHLGTQRGRRHLDRAYLAEDGSWAQGVLPGGAVDRNKNWWIYCELDQLAGTLALADPASGRYLPQTNNYWFRYFVDREHGDVWNGVNYGTNAPQRDMPKAWPWKNMYHDFEHVLVGYITAQQLLQQPFTLHYAFTTHVEAATIRPYFFLGTADWIAVTTDGAGREYQAVTFHGLAPAEAAPLTTTSAASYLPGSVSPGSIATAFGPNLSSATAVAAGLLPETLAGVGVSVQDSAGGIHAARLYYVSPAQVNFVLPADASTGVATITVNAAGKPPVSAEVEIRSAAPGIFQLNATGLAAANIVRVRADQSQVREPVYRYGASGAIEARPLDLSPENESVYLELYATGLRQAGAVTATVGGQGVPVLFSGAQGTFGGLDQVNIGPLPRSLAGTGRVNVILVADGQTAAPVEIEIQ